jgi:hypothetical protein
LVERVDGTTGRNWCLTEGRGCRGKRRYRFYRLVYEKMS